MGVRLYPTLFQHLATDYQRNLAVTAGAGTGKTEVLTRRIIKILAREQHCLDRLLVLTFTDKAAVEMKGRIYAAIENERVKTGQPHFQKLKDTFLTNYISTFHAFCAALLREYPIEAGLDPYFRVLDETDKVFFLKKSINRSLKELAAEKENRDIHLLSEEFFRTALANMIFTLIQKREDIGRWMNNFIQLGAEDYQKRLVKYRDCLFREMAYKLYQNVEFSACLSELKSVEPADPEDTSVVNRKRKNVLRLLPLFCNELGKSIEGSIDEETVSTLKKELLENTKLTGSPPKAWRGETYEIVKGNFMTIRYLLEAFNLEDFGIIASHEAHGFELLKALARATQYCIRNYQNDKAGENYLDFQDLQLKVLQLLEGEKHRHILDELRERFRYVMVDEFQDTNDIQWRIIRKIAADRAGEITDPKLFVVGDEKQAIYSFRGGDVRLFSRVRRELLHANKQRCYDARPFELQLDDEKSYEVEYGEKAADDRMMRAGEIVFSDNFRSAAAPINFFNMFFEDLLGKEIYEEYDARPQLLRCGGNKATGSVELLLVDDDDESMGENAVSDAQPHNSSVLTQLSPHLKEALLIAEKIKEVFLGDDDKYARVRENAGKGLPAVAILLNRRTMLKTYEEALRLNRIDFTVVRGRGFFQRQEIVDLGNLLTFLTNPMHDAALVAFLRSPAGHLSDEGIFIFSRVATGSSWWDKLSQLADMEQQDGLARLSHEDAQAVRCAAANLTRWLELSGRMPLVEFLWLILNEGGYLVSLARGERGDQALSNMEKLLDHAREIALQEGGDVADFCEWLNNRIDYIEDEGEADIDISLGGAVQIMTVHQSKGLEFPLVFVPDLAVGFNLGEREALYIDELPLEMTIEKDRIIRKEMMEIGVNAPNPENQWESEPILVKRIMKKRLRDKLIAEKKRLFYVAATRAMDHLVLVGHSKFSDTAAYQRLKYTPRDQLTNWMDWLNRILGISVEATGLRGVIHYGNQAGVSMDIPYRKFCAGGALHEAAGEYRTEFPVE